MAGAGMRDVKRRIKSVESTMQITKAMQLVASSKLRRAKERVETARPYFNTLYETICAMAAGNTDKTNLYTRPREVRRKAYVVIAGDRGLAGGYNVNILRFAESQMDPETALVIPVGKRAVDYFSRRAYETRVFQEYAAVSWLACSPICSAAVKQMKWCWCILNSLRCCPRCRPAARSCRCPLQRRNWKATARQIPLAQQNLIRPSGMSWPGSCPSLWAA